VVGAAEGGASQVENPRYGLGAISGALVLLDPGDYRPARYAGRLAITLKAKGSLPAA
jgi:hypothetical protein